MSVISSAVSPEHLLTQLQQSADAAVRRLKSFIYLHRNSGWYVNGAGTLIYKESGRNFLTIPTPVRNGFFILA